MLKRTGGPTVTPLVLRLNFRVFSRTYMAIYGCMAVFGCIWLDMAVYGCIWLYMAVYGLYMAVYWLEVDRHYDDSCKSDHFRLNRVTL